MESFLDFLAALVKRLLESGFCSNANVSRQAVYLIGGLVDNRGLIATSWVLGHDDVGIGLEDSMKVVVI